MTNVYCIVIKHILIYIIILFVCPWVWHCCCNTTIYLYMQVSRQDVCDWGEVITWRQRAYPFTFLSLSSSRSLQEKRIHEKPGKKPPNLWSIEHKMKQVILSSGQHVDHLAVLIKLQPACFCHLFKMLEIFIYMNNN